MKKVLSLVSSFVLALALAVPAPAQTMKKLSGATAAGHSVEQRATVETPVPKGFRMAKVRTAPAAGAVPSLHKAMNAATGIVRKMPFKKLAEGAELPNLMGSVLYNDKTGAGIAETGLYRIAGGATELVFEGPQAQYGGIPVDGVYYSTEYMNLFGMAIITITAHDLETGEELAYLYGSFDNLAMGVTTDPTTGTVYAITYNAEGNGIQLSTMSYSTSGVTTTAIAPMSGNWNTLVCDAQGQLYGIRYVGEGEGNSFVVTSSTLCKIDKATAEVTEIGDTGQLPQYITDGVIDVKTGRMFWNVCPPDESGILCEVDLTTGVATTICTLADNDEICGMFVDAPAAEDAAPAAVTDLAAEFLGGACEGTVSFTAPTTLFDGSAATGALDYEITANGTSVATGTTSFGAAESVPVTVPEAGSNVIAVTVSNAAGKSPKAKIEVFVGHGVPAAAKPELSYADGRMNLTWAPVTTTINGGYIDPAAVTYTVTRFPGEIKVAENISETSFSEEMAETDAILSFHYTVVAHSGAGLSSAAGVSNSVVLGSMTPPYSNSFDDASALDGFTILDENGDGKKWGISDGMAYMTYNTSLDMDDWLITVPMKLEAGKAYIVSFKTRNNGASYPERLEVKWGAQPTAAAMTGTVIEPTVIDGAKVVHELSGYITPETSGTYFIGFHGISDADSYYLFIDDLTVSAGMAATAPGAVTDIVITPDAEGFRKANVAFKAPAVDFAGNALTELTKVEVSRGGEVVKVFDSPAAGAELSFDDVLEAGGNVKWDFVAHNASGIGKPASATAFVGANKPAAPASVSIVETETPGEVKITWDAVTTDVDGNPVNSALITYTLCKYEGGWVPFLEGLTTTSHTFQAVEAGKQDFVQYGVFAVTDGGNNGLATDMIPVGTPYTSVTESFADGSLSYAWGVNTAGGAEWQIMNDTSLGDVASYDGDNGYLAMKAQTIDKYAEFFSGKVDLSGIENAGLSFYTYNIGGNSANEINVAVRELGAEEWTDCGTTVINTLGSTDGWCKMIVSLEAFAGKVVQFKIKPVVKQYTYTLIDLIEVGTMVGYDLAASGISAPSSVAPGESYNVDVTVTNLGVKTPETFKVTLYYADGRSADTKEVAAPESCKSVTVSFLRWMQALETEAVELYAVVSLDGDEDTENNTTDMVSIAPKQSKLPKVTDLSAEESAAGVELTWSEPDLSSSSETVTEDFEDATSWAQEMEGWTFVDKDESEVGGFQGTDIPGITAGGSKLAFFVFDASGDAFNQTFAAHSGDKYLAALFRYDDGQTDNWAISPELDGSAQTISFWARSYSSQYPEKIEMYYSTGSLDPADFVKVGNAIDPVGGEWTEYTFNVPDGAKHFAIRSCAAGSFMLMLDDITYSKGASAPLSVVGYEVYRDAVKITAEPTAETAYTDTEASVGEHSYVVIAVYESGKSAPSNTATVSFTGIEDVAATGITIEGGIGEIIVSGAEGHMLTVAALDGKLMFSGAAQARTTINVATGVYIVKAGTTVAKVAVK